MASKTLNLILFALVVFMYGCDKISAPPSVPDPTETGNYALIWFDEFDQRSTTPDPNKWNYDTGYGTNGWGNDEWQLYTTSQDNVKVEDGNLVITAKWDNVNFPAGPGKRNGSVTSGRINTKDKFAFKYGKAQARIKIPTTMGMWPAFWMLGQNHDSVGWPQCGEIDIMEASPLYHNNRTSMFTMHWHDADAGGHASYETTTQLSQPLSDDYHTYEVVWDEQRVVGKIDDITYFVKVIDPGTMDEFLREFFLVLNVAVGGNLGGTPDGTTNWPQSMYVDWVKVYQKVQNLEPVETYGIYTDTTPVDDGLTVGLNAEIYVWENTLAASTTAPYEGDNVISWTTTGVGWFGAGIQANSPRDLSGFASGNLKFMIKIPANVTFKIGFNDTQNHENYVTFPANQTAYGLERNGEWGQATIPVAAMQGSVDLQMINYPFAILEQQGTQCSFAIDDIYYDGGGAHLSNVSFSAASYEEDASSATVSLEDTGAKNSTRNVIISSGTHSISLEIALNYQGVGSGTLNFGPTNDATNTIEITAGEPLNATYTAVDGAVRTDSATITGGPDPNNMGIYSETHTNPMLPYTQIVNSADWGANGAEPNPTSTAVTPLDGTYALGVNFTNLGFAWGGIAFNFGSQNISSYTKLVFHINKSEMTSLTQLGIKFEDNPGGFVEVNLSAYTPTLAGNWLRYEIPFSHFPGVNFSQMEFLGFWSPRNSSGNLLFGNLYFDDIYLSK